MDIKINSTLSFDELIYDAAYGLAKRMIFKNKDEMIKRVHGFVLTGVKTNNSVYGNSKQLNKNVWLNPPYGRGYIKKFMAKAVEEKAKGVTTVMLVPATLDAQWLPINEISEIRIVTGGRLSFYHPLTNKKVHGNTKGSMFVIFRPSKMPCVIRMVDRNELIELGSS